MRRLRRSPISIFFSGIFRTSSGGPDPDARIGYCASKKLAYVGYKCHLICTSKHMAVLGFMVTPANVHDSKVFIPLFSRVINSSVGGRVAKAYGDNAYSTLQNRKAVKEHEIEERFHRKSETGKHPKNERSAKRKSKIRSKIETLFGIAHENLGFGRVRVRNLSNVRIDTCITFIGWNLGSLYAFFTDRLDDRNSFKKLLYKS